MTTPRIKGRLSILLPLLMVLSGCSVYHVPNMAPTTLDSKPSLQLSSVALINGHPGGGVIEIGRAGAGTMMGELKAWTRSAVVLLDAMLQQQGIVMNEAADKQLELSVVNARLGVSGLQYAGIPKCNVQLRVTAGSGMVREFVREKSALSPPSACDQALSASVAAIFTEEGLIDYLNQ
jgi:hypothetical protein